MNDSANAEALAGTTLRRACPEDASALTELAVRSKAYWGYDEQFMAACRDELAVSPEAIRHATTFVVETDRIVGFYMLCPCDARTVELEFLFVAPEQIGRGLGRRLVEHAKAIAREQGYRAILVQGDPHADGFYRCQGAERIGDRASASIEGRTLPVYRIELHARVK